MVWVEGEGFAQGILPRDHGLAGQPQNEVQAEVFNFGLPDVCDRLYHLPGGMDPVDAPQLLLVSGLGPQGNAVDPRPAQPGHGTPVHAVGVALHGDLCLAADGTQALEQGEDLPQAPLAIVGGGAAAEVDGVRHPLFQLGGELAQVGQQGPLVAVHLLLLAGQGVEVAVVTFAFAEGNVNINANGVGHQAPSNPAQSEKLHAILYPIHQADGKGSGGVLREKGGGRWEIPPKTGESMTDQLAGELSAGPVWCYNRRDFQPFSNQVWMGARVSRSMKSTALP